ncbi:MAG: hypothetical protein ABSG21_10760 [Spirochaetia bacterium]
MRKTTKKTIDQFSNGELFDEIEKRGYGIPYLIESQADVEQEVSDELDEKVRFKSERQYRHFIWCLRNDWDVFDKQTINDMMRAIRTLVKEGTKFRVPKDFDEGDV